MKSLFEQMGGTYTRQGDYYISDLALPPQEEFLSVGSDNCISDTSRKISECFIPTCLLPVN